MSREKTLAACSRAADKMTGLNALLLTLYLTISAVSFLGENKKVSLNVLHSPFLFMSQNTDKNICQYIC